MEGDRDEFLFDVAALRLQPVWDAEFFAEGFDGLIEGKSRRVRGEFEEHAAGLTEIDRMEIGPVEDGSDVQMLGEDLAPFFLRRIVLGAECDVVHGAGSGASELRGRIDDQIDVIAEGAAFGGVAHPLTFSADFLEAHQVQDGGGFGFFLLQEGHTEEASDRVFGRDGGEAWSVRIGGVGVGDDFNFHAVGIGEGEHLFFETLAVLEQKALAAQPFLPVFEGGGGDAESGFGHFTGAGVSASGVGPGKEREDRAGRTGVVAEVEVIRSWIVEINGSLDEAETENLGIEIEVSQWVGCYGGYVVESNDRTRHNQ